jgi:FkbM family methyltransferase
LISFLVRKPVLLNLRYFKIYVRLDDWAVGARIAIKRVYEKHVTEVMRTYLEPGWVVLDIGANIGYYTLLAASRVGPTGKIISFEPSADNCTLLQMSVQENGFGNVVLHTKAVADINGVVGYEGGRFDDSNGGINRDNPTACSTQVHAVALDTFLGSEPRIDLIKMDIEGAEGFALKGMAKLLEHHHPVLFTEFSPNALQGVSGISPEDYLKELRRLGYELYVLHRGKGQDRLPQSDQEITRCYAECKSDHLDLVAIPSGMRESTCA